MPAIDTNVLVRLAVGDDAGQVELAENFIQKGAWVSHVVLIEAVWVLRSYYGRSPQQIVQSIEMLLSNTDLTLQDADVVEAALALFRANPAIGFSDCLVLSTARKAGHLPLGAFDRALGKLDGAARIV
jgi:predicted nucleic-acid-binding protein